MIDTCFIGPEPEFFMLFFANHGVGKSWEMLGTSIGPFQQLQQAGTLLEQIEQSRDLDFGAAPVLPAECVQRQHRDAADWAILLGTALFACCPGTPARGDNQGGDTHKTVLRGGITL
jgi:hypothetical protein